MKKRTSLSSRSGLSRVALYARVSDGDTGTSASVEAQVADMTRFCAAQGWSVVGSYSDDETGRHMHRKGLVQLLEDAKAHTFDVVLVTTMDRLGRGAPFIVIEHLLKESGATVKMVHQDFERAGDEVGSYIQKAVQIVLDGLMPVDARSKTLQRMRVHFHDGYFVGGQLPFGYRSIPDPAGMLSRHNTPMRRLIREEEELDVVRRAIEAAADGERIVAVQAILAAGGGPASHTGARDLILSGDIYAGRVRWSDQTREAPELAIVSWEVLGAARRALADTTLGRPPLTRSATRNPLPLLGKIVCSCGRRMTSYWARGQSGVQVHYYRCRVPHCGAARRQLNALAVQRGILSELAAIASVPWKARHAAAWLSARSGNTEAQQRALRQAERDLTAAKQASAATRKAIGLCTNSEALRQLAAALDESAQVQAAAEERLAGAREDLRRGAARFSASAIQTMLASLPRIVEALTEPEREELLGLIVERVEVQHAPARALPGLIVEVRAGLLGLINSAVDGGTDLRCVNREVRTEMNLQGGLTQPSRTPGPSDADSNLIISATPAGRVGAKEV